MSVGPRVPVERETVYVALDVETTGLNPAVDRVIEVAAVRFNLDRVLESWQTLVRPQMVLPLAITKLTGLTQAELDRAPLLAQVLPTLRSFVRNDTIVGHSIEFDISMVRAGGLPLANPSIDTYELAALLMPELPTYGLSAVAAALKLTAPDGAAHRAGYDAAVSRLVFLGLWERIAALDAETLGEIEQLTAGTGWTIHPLFREALRRKAREGFGTSLGEALRQASRAKGQPVHEMGIRVPRSRPERLEPTGETGPLPLAALTAALRAGSPFTEAFGEFEERPQQLEMLQAVGQTLGEGGQLLVEAGTGTGKSLAYLLPAVTLAVQRGESVYISTKTIQLQDQLFAKDIPALRAGLTRLTERGQTELPADFRAAIVKGRSNYLCPRRWVTLRRTNVAADEARTLVKIQLWLQGTETGDRAELRLLPGEETTWARVMATPDACDAATCPFNRRGQCFLFRARREAEAAHLVVVNHALLLSDMVAGSQVLPAYEHLIIDEAHRLEDEATAQLGFSITRASVQESLESLARQVGLRQEGIGEAIVAAVRAAKAPESVISEASRVAEAIAAAVEPARKAATAFFERLEAFVVARTDGGNEQYDARHRLTGALRQEDGWQRVELTGEDLTTALAGVGRAVADATDLLERLAARALPNHDGLVADAAAATRLLADLQRHLASAVISPSSDYVYWCQVDRGDRSVSLHAAPLTVAPSLNVGLFEPRQTVILTSATLTVDGRFDYVRQRLGLDDAAERALDSPFDYETATMLGLAEDMPEPNRPGYQRQIEQGIVALCTASDGRALVLFTSHAALRATYAAVKPVLERQGILVLGQRIDGSPRQLLEKLRSDSHTVVFGSSTFWEGVDVVGDALSLLVITKLPFQVPTDPVVAARSELLDDAFSEHTVPQAILAFKQGFGRLIRSATDRGVVAVLDRRLVSKGYGRSFLASLPRCSTRRGSVADLARQTRAWLLPATPAGAATAEGDA